MAATITTKEPFDKGVTKKEVEAERKLRIQAGAIRSWMEKDEDRWVLYTEWNVIGEQ